MGEQEVSSAALFVGKLVFDEINYLDGVRDKVERLKAELIALANFLTEARCSIEILRSIISDGRDVAYDCQDLIETYVLQVQNNIDEEYEGLLGYTLRCACLLSQAVPVHRIGRQIDEINTRISFLHNRIRTYLPAIPIVRGDRNQNTVRTLRRVYSFDTEEFVVVGFDGYLKELLARLLDPNDKKVILICGMGGIGKSTLAKQLYRELAEKRNFIATGWAQATRQFNPEQVVQTLLYSLAPEYDRRRRGKIEREIRANRAYAALNDQMKREKCVVIIDDIWSPENWEDIKSALPIDNQAGSRIILTSRNCNILADLDDSQKLIQNVEPLDDLSSRDLFEKITFPPSTMCTDTEAKRKLGREMIQHCGGVPMAITVLAKVLKRKEEVTDWENTKREISSQIQGGGAANDYKQVYNVLRVSYDDLPSNLKLCFLHLANFPQGYEIPAQKLYQLWNGEGITEREVGETSIEEEIAEKNLKELVSRSMVQVGSWVGTEIIKTCRLHDLMRDVCIQIATNENFLLAIKTNKAGLLRNEYLTERDKSLRRLAVYMDEYECKGKSSKSHHNVSKAPKLRTLLVFPVGQQSGEAVDCKNFMETMVTKYPFLRILDCENSTHISGVVPDKVEKLIHLRYLGLANTGVSKLPSSIRKLQWLQTLDLQVDKDLVLSLPNVLWMMKRLRHVYLPHYGGPSLIDIERVVNARQRYLISGGEALRLDGLKHLQTMINLDLDRVNPRGLHDLERLRRLSAVCMNIDNITALFHFLKCPSLEAFMLKLHACVLEADRMLLSSSTTIDQLELYAEPYSNFHFTKPMNSNMFPQNLTSLSLLYLQLDDDPLPVLEKLPNVYYLGLVLCYDEGKIMVCSAGGFRKLTMIYLDALINLEHWEVAQGALPNLNTLLIINCRKLNIPEAFATISDRTIFNEDECSNPPEPQPTYY